MDENIKTAQITTSSYENPYEELLTKYKDTQNFSNRMWDDALSRGEQDTYLDLLSKTSGIQMSDKFSNPAYYDFDANMLEMYSHVADDKEKKTSSYEVYNPETKKIETAVTEPMTERESIVRELEQYRKNQDAVLQYNFEKVFKNNLNWLQKTLGSIATGAGSVATGAVGASVDIADFFAHIARGIGAVAQGYDYAEGVEQYYRDDSLRGKVEQGMKADLIDYARRRSFYMDIDGNWRGIGQELWGIGESVGQMLPSVATSFALGGVLPSAVSSILFKNSAMFYTSVYSSRIYENVTNDKLIGTPAALKIGNAALTTASEWVIEKALSSLLNRTTFADTLRGVDVKGGAEAIQGLRREGLRGRAWMSFLADMAQEGLEEVLQDFGTHLINEFTAMYQEGYHDDDFSLGTLAMSFLSGAALSLIMSGTRIGVHKIASDVRAIADAKTIARGDTDVDVGLKSDIFVKGEDGKAERLQGISWMYASEALSAYYSALDDAVNGQASVDELKSLVTANEILAQFFGGATEGEIKNCMILLNRVAQATEKYGEIVDIGKRGQRVIRDVVSGKSEKHAARYSDIDKGIAKTYAETYAALAAGKDTDTDLTIGRSARLGAATAAYRRYIAETLAASAKSLVTESRKTKIDSLVSKSVAEKTNKAADSKTVGEKLTENGVTKTIAVKEKGQPLQTEQTITEEKTPEMQLIEKKLNDFSEYDNIIVTDGHVAIEADNLLYVSQSWLENYETSDIYKFLSQQKVLDTILNREELEPLVKSIKFFVSTFADKADMNTEEAVMQFLFNPSVFQAYILKDNGINLHEYKNFLFQFDNMISALTTNEKLSRKQRAFVKQIQESIHQTQRKPAIIAAINWGIDVQKYMPEVLRPADIDFIQQTNAQRRKLALQFSAYNNETDLLTDYMSSLNKEDVIRGLNAPIGSAEYLDAYLMLDAVDDDLLSQAKEERERVYKLLDKIGEESTVSDTSAKQVLETINIISTHRHWFDTETRKYFAQFKSVQDVKSAEISVLLDNLSIVNSTLSRFVSKTQKYRTTHKGVISITTGKNVPILTDRDTYMAQGFVMGSTIDPSIAQEWSTAVNTVYAAHNITNASAAESLMVDYLLGKNTSRDAMTLIDEIESLVNGERTDVRYSLAVMKNADGKDVLAFTKDIKAEDVLNSAILAAGSPDAIGKRLYEIVASVPVGQTVSASTFLSTEVIEHYYLKDIIFAIDPAQKKSGQTFGSSITFAKQGANIDGAKFLTTFLHELTHAINYKTGAFEGGSPETIKNRAPQLMAWSAVNLPISRRYAFTDFPRAILLINALTRQVVAQNGTYVDLINALSDVKNYRGLGKDIGTTDEKARDLVIDRLAFIAYRALTDELLARRNEGNLRAPIGIHHTLRIENAEVCGVSTKDMQTLSIKEIDKLKRDSTVSISRSDDNVYSYKTDNKGTVAPEAKKNLYADAFVGAVIARQATGADAEIFTTDDIHSILTQRGRYSLISGILDKDVDWLTASTITIDQIIKDPAAYLSSTLLNKMNGNYSEGNVFAILNDYFMDHMKGIAIDRDSRTHEYIFVDNRHLEKLYKPSIVELRDSTEDSLVKKYKGSETVYLDDFIYARVLERMGIAKSVKVNISEDVNTETRVTKEGQIVIDIKATPDMTNAQLLVKISHELRHVFQYASNLEAGFTPDFKMSDEMLADIKAHAPELFTKDMLSLVPKEGLTEKQKEIYQAQYFTYLLTHGELNAYGIRNGVVITKPVYVGYEAGKPTVYLPWYNEKTGKGAYRVDFLAGRMTEDEKRQKIEKMKATKAEKKEAVKASGLLTRREHDLRSYLYDKLSPEEKLRVDTLQATGKRWYPSRYITKEEAENTNLKYIKQNGHNTVDPRVKEVYIASTGNESWLPPEIMYAIYRGKLTYTSLNNWFRETPLDTMNDETFKFFNDNFFHNEVITTVEDLKKAVSVSPSRVWASVVVLYKNGLSPNDLTKIRDVSSLEKLLSSVVGDNWKKQVDEQERNFMTFAIQSGDRINVEQLVLDEKIQGYYRTLVMELYNGSFANAYYLATQLRRLVIYQQKSGSLEETFDDSDIHETKQKNQVSTEDALEYATERGVIDNDIISLYSKEKADISEEDAIFMLIERKKLIARRKFNREYAQNYKDKKELVKARKLYIDKEVLAYQKKLATYDSAEIRDIFDNVSLREAADLRLRNENLYRQKKDYINPSQALKSAQTTIKSTATNIITLMSEGKIRWDDLSPEAQALFSDREVVINGKKRMVKVLNDDAYLVGRGAAPGARSWSKGGHTTKDISQILHNRDVLLQARTDARAIKVLGDNTSKAAKRALREAQKQNRRTAKLILKEAVAEKSEKTQQTKTYVVKEKTTQAEHKTTVYFNEEMPRVLDEIFATSFNELADTSVQFASRDEKTGKLYEKTDPEFESRVKHERVSWDAFYEANRNRLRDLTRADAEDIIKWIKSGSFAVDGETGKFNAFQIFTLGYIIDTARMNILSWDFSQAEIEAMEQVFEAKASAAGSGLNAVGQMRSVINPFREVAQRMLDEYNVTPDETDEIITRVRAIENAQTPEAKTQRTEDAIAYLSALEKKMATDDMNKKKKTFLERIESYRFLAMLSSPATWARNLVNNILVSNLNKASDGLAKVIFRGKGAIEGQYDINKIKVSTDVDTFVDDYFAKNTKLLNLLYASTTKYTDRERSLRKENSVLAGMVLDAFEARYAADHRFNSKAMNAVSRLIGWGISDETFIKNATDKYFKKMLQAEIDAGNIKMTDGQIVINNKVWDVFADAVITASMDFMHKPSFISQMMRKLKETAPTVYEAVRAFFPFMNASFNWYVEALRYTPIGLIGAIVDYSKIEAKIADNALRISRGQNVTPTKMTQYLAQRNIGKGIVGTLGLAFGMILTALGRIRFSEKDDKYFIHVGDMKVDISSLFSSSSILTGAAIVQSIMDAKDGQFKLEDLAAAITDTVTEGSIIRDVMQRYKYEENYWGVILSLGESFTRSFVPQMIQLIVRATNQQQIKYSKGVEGSIERFVNSLVPTQPAGSRVANIYTGEMQNKYAIPVVSALFVESGLLGGMRYYFDNISETEKFVTDAGLSKGRLTGEITLKTKNGKKIVKIDSLAVNEKYGKLNAETLLELKTQRHQVQMPNGTFKTLAWSALSDEQKQRVIERTMSVNAKIAKIAVWTDEGHKYYASDSEYKILMRAGIRANVYHGDRGYVE